MVTNEYIEKLNNNISKLIDEDTFIKTLRHDNNLGRFNIFNRIAFAVLNKQELFDLKTKEEWFDVGRKVIDTKNIIHTLIPIYKISYVDSESSELIDLKDFTDDEIHKAIELGVINKIDRIEDFICYNLYDIRNTSNIDKENAYEVPKPIINIHKYFEIINNITGIHVEESDDITFFSEKEKLLFLHRGSYADTLESLSEIVIKHMIKHSDKYMAGSIDKYLSIKNKKLEKLLITSAVFSILTIFGIINKNKLIVTLRQSGVTSYEDLVDILVIVDELTTNIISRIEYTNNSVHIDAISNINMIKKSELLLNILQANSIHNKLEGN